MLIIVSLLLLFPIALLLAAFMPRYFEVWVAAVYIGSLGMFLALIGLFLTVFWGIARRRQWGRWLGVMLLSIVVVYGIGAQVKQFAELWEWYKFGVAFEYLAGPVSIFIAGWLLIGLVIWVIISLTVGNRVSAFFSSNI